MAYCTSDQVRAIVDSDVTDAEITELIDETDALLDERLDTGSMGATLLRMLSRLYTAWRVMLKDPNARSLGEYSEDRSTTLEMMREELAFLMGAVGGGGIAFTPASESLG